MGQAASPYLLNVCIFGYGVSVELSLEESARSFRFIVLFSQYQRASKATSVPGQGWHCGVQESSYKFAIARWGLLEYISERFSNRSAIASSECNTRT